MKNPYYNISSALYGHPIMLWSALVTCVALSLVIILLNYDTNTTPQKSFMDIFVTFFGLLGMGIFFLIPCINTFKQLDSERGVYKNHKIQELVFTFIYTLGFSIIFLGFILVVYENAYN